MSHLCWIDGDFVMAKFDAEAFVREIDGSSKAELMKKFGPKIKSEYGMGEFNFIKDDATGPGGVDNLRRHIKSLFMRKGGVVTKKLRAGGLLKKKMRGGGMAMHGKAKMAKKKMRGGGMTKRMRGGGMMKKKMMGGGMAKMSKKKKMMRGGMAKKKR